MNWKNRYSGKPVEKPVNKQAGWSPSCYDNRTGYAIINSEIGPIYCYDYGRDSYEEFFTGLACHPVGYTLVFDYCDTGFRAVKESASGNDTFYVEKVSKERFALGIDNCVRKYGSKENAKADFEQKLRDRIAYRDENLRRYYEEQERKNAFQKKLDYQSREAINKYGIR